MRRWLASGVVAISLIGGLVAIRPGLSHADQSTMPARARIPQVAADTALGAPTGVPTPNTVPVTIHDSDSSATLVLEVASTEAERETGLMNRTSLPADGGMLFLFPYTSSLPFWMKDTPTALDIAFIDVNGVVITVRHGVPFDLTDLFPTGPYRNAIEVNAGWFAAHGLGVGAQVDLPPGLPTAKF